MTKPTTTLWIATTAYKSGLVIKRNGEMPNYQQLVSNDPEYVAERMRREQNRIKKPAVVIKMVSSLRKIGRVGR